MDLFKLDNSLTIQPINRRHNIRLLNPILFLHEPLLAFGNMLQRSSHTQNTIKIRRQSGVREMRNDQVHRDHSSKRLIADLLVYKVLVIVGKDGTVAVVDQR